MARRQYRFELSQREDELALAISNGHTDAVALFTFAELGGEYCGMEFSVTAESLGDFREGNRIVRRMLGKGHDLDATPTLATVAAGLKRAKAVQVVYDPRVGETLPIGQLMPADARVYRDDPTGTSEGEPQASVIANSEAAAQMELLHKLADAGSFDYLAQWLDQGRAVVASEGAEAPSYVRLSELVAEPEAEAEEAEAE